MNVQSHVAISPDGLPIRYDVQGDGAIALIFVHGWCCDRRCWDRQVEHFAPHHTVVCLDLAGHGLSGRDRTQWTVPAFGQDIVAVVEHLGLEQVVLIGHSMGGRWIVEAARRLSTAVIGLVSVDTWADVEQTPTPEEVAARLEPFRAHFVEAMRTFVRGLFVPTSEPTLVEHVMASMSAAPPHIGIGAAEEAWGDNRQLREGLQEVTAPKIAINNASFVMLEDPQMFNRLLDDAVQKFLKARTRQ
jgi:pimeloyl-ACP methyl ester carboxylesterase